MLLPDKKQPLMMRQQPPVGPERISRLSPAVLSLLNTQIKNELYSAQIYAHFASWCDSNDWVGGSKLFLKYSKEEQVHMYKIYEYIFDRNSKANVSECPPVNIEITNIRDLLEQSLAHEMQVTKNWTNIATTALSENDHTTYELSQWFIKEQIEEEIKFREYLQKLNVGLPYWKLDELFGENA